MDKKKNIKQVISLVCMVALVILLAAMPLLAKQEREEDGPKASILSGSVTTGNISTELIGGGTLAEEEAVTISVPSAVKLTKFLVSNGDAVTEGTPIAKVDRVSVMTAISQVQETLEYLSEEIEDASDINTTENVNALAGGIVKILYAEKGDSVQSVMLEHGALAVLSLDGLMAVDFETESNLSAGTAVSVTLSDGEEISGKIAKNLAGEITVTLEDDDYPVGDTVTVTFEGTEIGSGELYIYSPWNATAYTGTVDTIRASVGDQMNPGKTLMVLKDVGHSAAYYQLIAQRQEYEDLMLDLFKMYQTETIDAPCDGVVSGIDKDSAQLLSDNGKGYVIRFLANSPNGNDEALYVNYVGKVTAVGQNGLSMLINPQPIAIADYKDLFNVPMDESDMTLVYSYSAEVEEVEPPVTEEPEPSDEVSPREEVPAPADKEEPTVQYLTVPVYELSGGSWQQISFHSLTAGDIVLMAADANGEIVWFVRIRQAVAVPDSNENFTESGGFPSGGMGGFNQTPEPAFELYSLEMTEIAAVTPQNTMTLEIQIDELDVNSLKVGMPAQIKIGALGGEKHTATITDIGNSGTNNGGSSKYTVELTIDRVGNMLSGMNATAIIVLSTKEDILTIPADALVEQGNQTLVYTSYDAETETLSNPVTVIVGTSDGETVEILDGLSQGQTYYYAYYDTLEISFTPDFGGGMFG